MKELKPPYVPSGWIDNFFELVRRMKLEKVDRHILNQYNVVDLGNSSKVVSALKFLGLIDDKSKINEEKVRILRLEGDARKKEFQEIIKSAYSDLFNKIDLEHARNEDLKNYFIGCGYSSNLANNSAKLFLHFAKLGEIKLSENLNASIEPSKRGRPKGSSNIGKKTKQTKSIKKEKEALDPNPLEEGAITIQVRGKGTSLNLSLNTAEDIQPNLEIVSKFLRVKLSKNRENKTENAETS